MGESDTKAANAEQIEYWTEQAGPKWVRLERKIDDQIAPLGRLAMDALGLEGGERVLDVGCGCGATTLELAGRVGPSGAVTGIDVSSPMLARAREAASAPNVTYREADAQTHAFSPGSFDGIFSRFGVMFFEDPTAAFRNLRAALRPGGRLAFACWQALPENPWMLVPCMAAAAHVPLPDPPAPDAPGPFSFADPDRVRRILGDAGFRDVRLDDVRRSLAVGGSSDLDEVTAFLVELGPLSRLLRDADPSLREPVAAAVRASIEPYLRDGTVTMPSASWIVTAEAPS